MRTLTIFILLMMVCNAVIAQNNFEGIITYLLNSKTKKVNALADVYFKKDKIKAALRTKEGEEKSKDDLIILLDSGIVYHLNLAKGTCTKDDLNPPSSLSAPPFLNTVLQNKTILGFNCNAVTLEKKVETRFMGGAAITLWQANSLLFPCNKKFATGEMSVAFINGNNINLAAEFIFDTPSGKDTATVYAIKITPAVLAASVFALPANMLVYTNYHNGGYDTETISDASIRSAVDSAARAVDSVVRSIMKKETALKNKSQKKSLKSTSKKAASQNTHKQPTKTPVTKPKE